MQPFIRLGLLVSIVLTTIMVDHYPLVEFLCESACSKIKMFIMILIICMYKSYSFALTPPLRHQHPWCFHYMWYSIIMWPSYCFRIQAQTRSADEPMTTFAYCNDCGNRWKVYIFNAQIQVPTAWALFYYCLLSSCSFADWQNIICLAQWFSIILFG